jgi:hypothetical protein
MMPELRLIDKCHFVELFAASVLMQKLVIKHDTVKQEN